jgi:hypothetical protein
MTQRNSIDVQPLAMAIKGLLAVLPDTPEITRGGDGASLRRLRADIQLALTRLQSLAQELDPFRMPSFVFDPTNPQVMGSLVGRAMMEQSRYRLNEIPKIYGSGVYALFYTGDFDAYTPIRNTDCPIYVGKADPPSPEATTVAQQGPKLVQRLQEHAKSIGLAESTLAIRDFDCRFLVVQSGWQRAAEEYLINHYAPIWNQAVATGFGKHGDSHMTRANTRSPWDTLHPGRPWATRSGNRPNPQSIDQIKASIAEHFRRHPTRPSAVT